MIRPGDAYKVCQALKQTGQHKALVNRQLASLPGTFEIGLSGGQRGLNPGVIPEVIPGVQPQQKLLKGEGNRFRKADIQLRHLMQTDLNRGQRRDQIREMLILHAHQADQPARGVTFIHAVGDQRFNLLRILRHADQDIFPLRRVVFRNAG